MENLLSKVTGNLLKGKSVVLVGTTDTGKTYWVKNTLIPHLESLGKRIEYLKDGHDVLNGSPDIVICDEVETLFDKEYLEKKSGDKNYYTEKYLDIVENKWFKNYSSLPPSSLFIITRNESEDIDNLVQNFKKADWDNREITVEKFEKTTEIM